MQWSVTLSNQFYRYEAFPHAAKDCDRLAVWKSQSENFPRLAIVGKYILGIPASSATSERFFSAFCPSQLTLNRADGPPGTRPLKSSGKTQCSDSRLKTSSLCSSTIDYDGVPCANIVVSLFISFSAAPNLVIHHHLASRTQGRKEF